MGKAEETGGLGAATEFELNIVLVDDEAFDRRNLSRLAGKLGPSINVQACADEAEFRKTLDGGVFDICFVDNNMGAWNGVQAVDLLHHHPRHRDTPAVMVSARDDSETVVRAMKAGCANYLEKGQLTAERLRETVYDALSDALAETVGRDQLAHVADCIVTGMSNGCIGELRPRLRTMYRQISFIRSCHVNGLLPSPEALDLLETQCLEIWRFTDELANYGRTFTRLH
ncbi:response regulator [Marinibacterium sp. SX1]|uniref:response regulator n=1 Tax=Marinibacterium sp. SX1 TaxID=3388424 RepID=UPI003D16D6E6